MDRIERSWALRKLRDGASREVLLSEDQVLVLPSDRKTASTRAFEDARDRSTVRRVSLARIHTRRAELTTNINSRRDALIGAGIMRKSELQAYACLLRTRAMRATRSSAIPCAPVSNDSLHEMTQKPWKNDRRRGTVGTWGELRATRTDSEVASRQGPRARCYQLQRALMAVLAKRLSLSNMRLTSLALAVRK